MTDITPTQTRLLRAIAAATPGTFSRVRGGYCADLPPKHEVFTIRTVRAAERAGLVEGLGQFGAVLRLTSEGRAAIAGVDATSRDVCQAGATARGAR